MLRDVLTAGLLLTALPASAGDVCQFVAKGEFAAAMLATVTRNWAAPVVFDDEYGARVAECIANGDPVRDAVISVAAYGTAEEARVAYERLVRLARARAPTWGARVQEHRDPGEPVLETAAQAEVIAGVAYLVRKGRWLVGVQSSTLVADARVVTGKRAVLRA